MADKRRAALAQLSLSVLRIALLVTGNAAAIPGMNAAVDGARSLRAVVDAARTTEQQLAERMADRLQDELNRDFLRSEYQLTDDDVAPLIDLVRELLASNAPQIEVELLQPKPDVRRLLLDAGGAATTRDLGGDEGILYGYLLDRAIAQIEELTPSATFEGAAWRRLFEMVSTSSESLGDIAHKINAIEAHLRGLEGAADGRLALPAPNDQASQGAGVPGPGGSGVATIESQLERGTPASALIHPLPLLPPVRVNADRHRPVFLQFLNPEIRKCYGRGYTARNLAAVLQEALLVTRLAVLATEDSLVMPATYLFEVPILRRYLTELAPLREAGFITYSSHIPDLTDYAEHKAPEYRSEDSNPYTSKSRIKRAARLVWRPRVATSAADDIADEWRSSLADGGFLASTLRSVRARWPANRRSPEDTMESVPELLDGRAFIGRYVASAIPVRFTADESAQVDMFLSRSYLRSYLGDLDAVILGELPHGDLTCGVGRLPDMSDRVLSARRIASALKFIGLRRYVFELATWTDLFELKDSPGTGIVFGAAAAPQMDGAMHAGGLRAQRRIRATDATSFSEATERLAVLAEEILTSEAFGTRSVDGNS
jgi:hypothetical protein